VIVKELFAKLGLEVDEVAFEKGEALIHGLHAGFLAFAGAAVAGAAIVGAAFAKNFADAAGAANRMAQQMGLPLEASQELAFAAEHSGASLESLRAGLGHLASTGVKDLQGHLFKLAKQFEKMPDGAKKIALARKAFGRGGQELIPFLNKGAEGIRHFMEEAKELGVVLTAEDVKSAKEFKKELHEFEAASTAAGYAIGRALLPYVTKFVRWLNELGKSLHKIPQFIRDHIQWFKGLAIVLGTVLLTAIYANIGALAALAAGYISAGAAAVASGVAAVAAWVAAALPFIGIAAAIAFVLIVLEDLYQFLTGGESVIGDFSDYVKKEFGGWKGFFGALWDWIKDLFSRGWDFIVDKAKKALALAKELLKLTPGGSLMLKLLPNASSAVFGGGASPDASVGAAVNTGAAGAPQVLAPTFQGGPVTINAAAGMDTKDIANQVTAAQDEWWDAKMRTGWAGVD
jgi:phage-related minor tail protein